MMAVVIINAYRLVGERISFKQQMQVLAQPGEINRMLSIWPF
jgi:hypothetical protein